MRTSFPFAGSPPTRIIAHLHAAEFYADATAQGDYAARMLAQSRAEQRVAHLTDLVRREAREHWSRSACRASAVVAGSNPRAPRALPRACPGC
jgi:hypothetical protein